MMQLQAKSKDSMWATDLCSITFSIYAAQVSSDYFLLQVLHLHLEPGKGFAETLQ